MQVLGLKSTFLESRKITIPVCCYYNAAAFTTVEDYGLPGSTYRDYESDYELDYELYIIRMKLIQKADYSLIVSS